MPFGQRVGVALGQGQLDHHLRAQCVVAGHQRHQQQAQAVRAMQTQAAAGREVRATGFAHRLFGQQHDLPRALEKPLARLAHAQTPRGAVQQAGLQLVFQLGNDARNLRRRNVQGIGGRSEAATFHHTGEGTHGMQHVHEGVLLVRSYSYVTGRNLSRVSPFIVDDQ
ncbi:hypothetical protein D3C76_1363950 [compost metagenome]